MIPEAPSTLTCFAGFLVSAALKDPTGLMEDCNMSLDKGYRFKGTREQRERAKQQIWRVDIMYLFVIVEPEDERFLSDVIQCYHENNLTRRALSRNAEAVLWAMRTSVVNSLTSS